MEATTMNRDMWITRPDNTEDLRQRLLNIGVAIIALVAAIILLGACSENAHMQEKTSDIDTHNSTIAPGVAVDSSVMDQHTIDVTLNEYGIEMPGQVQPGPTLFRVTNAGKEEHNFQVEGNGGQWKLDANIPQGQTQMLRADLKPGTYEIYCPVGDHRAKGMSMPLSVAE
jgi:plastocyanin